MNRLKAVDFFVTSGIELPLSIKKRLTFLASGLIISSILFLLLSIVSLLLKIPFLAGISFLTTIIGLLSLFLLRWGKSRLTLVLCSMTWTVFVFTVCIRFDSFQNFQGVAAIVGINVLVILFVILAGNSLHILLVLSISQLILFFGFFPVLALIGHSLPPLPLALPWIVLGGLFQALVVLFGGSIIKDQIAISRKLLAEINRQQYEKSASESAISAAQEKVQKSGVALLESAEKTIANIHKQAGLVSGTTDGIKMLYEMLKAAVDSNRTVSDTHAIVNSSLNSYTKEIDAETKIVLALIASIERLAASSQDKQNAATASLEAVHALEIKMSGIASAIDKMEASVQNMDSLTSMITDVADRTNLLAMNASIEAAHAGQYGKGFAVIAGEIRNLSNQTTERSKAIASGLAETGKYAGEVTNATIEAKDFFTSMSADMLGIAKMLQDFITEMVKMQENSQKVQQFVYKVETLSLEIKQALQNSQSSIVDSNSAISMVMEIADTISLDANSLIAIFDEMLNENKANPLLDYIK